MERERERKGVKRRIEREIKKRGNEGESGIRIFVWINGKVREG